MALDPVLGWAFVGVGAVAGIAAGSSDAEMPGWSVDYRYDQAPLKPPTVPDDHVMLADIDVEALRIASAEQCQLGT